MQLSSVFRFILFVTATLLPTLYSQAQSVISVKEEEYNDQETTAQIDGRKDVYGKVYALVIVHNVEPAGYTFEADGARVDNTTLKSGEKVAKVYLRENTKTMRIRHSDPSIKGINYTFENGPLRSAHTYHIYLNPVYSASRIGQQYLIFNVTPPAAILEVEEDPVGQPGKYVPWLLDDGSARKLLRYGTYKYQVRATDYYSSAGSVTVNDPATPVVENINLRPRFGYLTIRPSATLEGATIFIDGMPAGTSSLSRHALSSGSHQVKINKPLYKMYDTTVEITDGNETTINPTLESNAARVTLTSPDSEAEILMREGLDDRNLGTGTWTGTLETGDYLIIVRRPGHSDATKQISVKAGDNLSVTLPAPVAHYGSVNFMSKPSGATVTVDGKNMGVTPRVINNMLEGEHTVTISKTGFSDYTAVITVKRDEVTDFEANLSDQLTFTITGDKPDSVKDASTGVILLPGADGFYTTPYGSKVIISGTLPDGGHSQSYSSTVVIDKSGKIPFKIPRRLLGYKEFYVSLGYGWTGYSAVSMALGYTFNHFNIELSGEIGGKSAVVYRYSISSASLQQKATSEVKAAFGLKLGYSLRIGNRLRVTPRVGLKMLSGTNTYFDGVDSPAMMSLPVEVLVNLQLARHISLYLAPAYRLSLGEKPYTSVLYDSNKYWTEGPALSAGISFNF